MSPCSDLTLRSPRILFIDQTAQVGGAELSLLDLIPRLCAEPTVLLFESGPFERDLEAAGVRVVVEPAARAVQGVRRDSAGFSTLLVLPALLRLVASVARRAQEFDLLYANTQKAFVVAALAGRIARRPVVWHLRDLLTSEHFSRLNRIAGIFLSRTCTARVIANSRATAQAFLSSGGSTSKLRVVYNGLDPTPFDAVRPQAHVALRRELGLGDEAVVGVFSRLAPWKGQHVLLDALPLLPNVQALLVGGALFREKAYEQALRQRATHLGVAERVHFLGFRRDVVALMRCCDVVVHTSVAAEPFGRVIAEAMLANRPVVASRAGGALELITEGETGLLVEPGDPEALAAAIRDLLVDPELRRHLATNAEVRIREGFTAEATVVGVARVIAEVLSGPQ